LGVISFAVQIIQCSSEEMPSQSQARDFILKPANGHSGSVLSFLSFLGTATIPTSTSRLTPLSTGLQLIGRGVATRPSPAATGSGGVVSATVHVVIGRGGPNDHTTGTITAEDDGGILMQADDFVAEGDVQIR
jgi:hypothetical protein